MAEPPPPYEGKLSVFFNFYIFCNLGIYPPLPGARKFDDVAFRELCPPGGQQKF